MSNVCFSPNGRFVLAFNLDNCIRLWDYVSGSVKKTYQGHRNSSFSIGGSFGWLTTNPQHDRDDGREESQAFIASASEDGDIVMWDVTSKQIVQRISKAHEGVCFWVDIHGDTLVSAGRDGKIRVFKHKSAERLQTAVNGVGDQAHAILTNGHTEEESLTPDLPATEEAVAIKQEDSTEEQS